MASVFFVEKKNSKKYIIQDYCYLNKWTIKNNYSFLLILNIVENIGTKNYLQKQTCNGYTIMYE